MKNMMNKMIAAVIAMAAVFAANTTLLNDSGTLLRAAINRGTTVIFVAGSVMALAATGMLVARKRRAIEE